MELTMTRLLLLTIVSAILPVSMVSANPWRIQANQRAELQDALDYLKKHLSDNEMNIAPGSNRMKTIGSPIRQMEEFQPVEAAGSKPMYDQRFNFGNQRETAEVEPIEMLINEKGASDDELSELDSANMDLDESMSEGALVDDLIADIIAKEILDDLEKVPADDDEPLNTIEDAYTADESPVSFDYDEEMQNYERFLAQTMKNQGETPIENNNLDNEIDEDLLNEVMMTFLQNNEDDQEQTRNNILTNEFQDDSNEEPLLTEEEEPLLTEEEEEILVAENILREIEDELKRQKIKQAELEKKKTLKVKPATKPAPVSCPVLDYLVDDCEIAAVDGIGGDGYRQAFRMPCNWHQICYTCGYSYGISQEICDEAFYLEMLSRCGKSQACNDRADFFLLAVVEDRVPLLKSPSVCQKKCVSDFLLGLEE